jgi:hypothetical protein
MANDSNGAPPGGASNYQEPPQPEHTPEQLAMIHAAMMEELGITRKDALHLQDRGPDISELRPLKQKRYQETATARWRGRFSLGFAHFGLIFTNKAQIFCLTMLILPRRASTPSLMVNCID